MLASGNVFLHIVSALQSIVMVLKRAVTLSLGSREGEKLGETLDRGSINLPRPGGKYVIMFIHMTSSWNHVCKWPIRETQKTPQAITVEN